MKAFQNVIAVVRVACVDIVEVSDFTSSLSNLIEKSGIVMFSEANREEPALSVTFLQNERQVIQSNCLALLRITVLAVCEEYD